MAPPNITLIEGTLVPAAEAQLSTLAADVAQLQSDLAAMDVLRARLYNAGAPALAEKIDRLVRELGLGYQTKTDGIAIPEAPGTCTLPGAPCSVRVSTVDSSKPRETAALLTGAQAVISWP